MPWHTKLALPNASLAVATNWLAQLISRGLARYEGKVACQVTTSNGI